jgi:hypothetical protein
MANINKDYNITEANKIFKKYNKLSGFNPLIETRKTKAVYFRALLYKVLMDFNYMNDRQIEDYFLVKGKKISRASVFTAIKKVDMYYSSFLDFRGLYDLYFLDKIKAQELINRKKHYRVAENNKRIDKRLSKYKNSKLTGLVDTIPKEREEEVFERLQLMVKSWSWKSKDRCEIIEASEGIENNTF